MGEQKIVASAILAVEVVLPLGILPRSERERIGAGRCIRNVAEVPRFRGPVSTSIGESPPHTAAQVVGRLGVSSAHRRAWRLHFPRSLSPSFESPPAPISKLEVIHEDAQGIRCTSARRGSPPLGSYPRPSGFASCERLNQSHHQSHQGARSWHHARSSWHLRLPQKPTFRRLRSAGSPRRPVSRSEPTSLVALATAPCASTCWGPSVLTSERRYPPRHSPGCKRYSTGSVAAAHQCGGESTSPTAGRRPHRFANAYVN